MTPEQAYAAGERDMRERCARIAYKSAASAANEKIAAAIAAIPIENGAASETQSSDGGEAAAKTDPTKLAAGHGAMPTGTREASLRSASAPSEATPSHDGGSPGPTPHTVEQSSSDPASGRSQPSPVSSSDVLFVAARLRGKGVLHGECGEIEHRAVRSVLEEWLSQSTSPAAPKAEPPGCPTPGACSCPPAASKAEPVWECMGRKQSLPEPGDCNWPDCGCDPHATKVIESLVEQGWTAPKSTHPPVTLDREAVARAIDSQSFTSGVFSTRKDEALKKADAILALIGPSAPKEGR